MPIYLPRTAASSGQPLEVWGCVRPADSGQLESGGAAQFVRIELAAAGGHFRTITRLRLTDPYGYFDVPVKFRSSGLVRLAWSYPRGPSVHSRTVSITIR
jgi:hypothetical protein